MLRPDPKGKGLHFLKSRNPHCLSNIGDCFHSSDCFRSGVSISRINDKAYFFSSSARVFEKKLKKKLDIP
ncbi:MAG: hypothetical protein KAW42_07220 [Candidatus Atribacteria bacterium]|jgi:hypothetical protein|nr:hypothetical protein [Candidatus Atribacteria bacterium]